MGHDIYRHGLFEKLREKIYSDPRASEAELREAVWKEIKGDIGEYRLLYDNWFIRNYMLLRDRIKVDPKTGAISYAAPKRHNSYIDQSKISRSVASLHNKLVLLDLLMPNGKQLRDCTFKEVGAFGFFGRDLAKLGKATEVVGKKLTEQQIRNIWARQL